MSPRSILASLLVASVLASALAACGSDVPPTVTPAEAGSFSVNAVQWNVDGSEPGQVTAVAETGGNVAVFSDKGALVFAGGALATSDATVTSWQRAATTITAPDSLESWVVASGADGHLYRLRALRTLEDVSDRFGLLDAKIVSIAAGSSPWIVFGLEDGIAVSNGKNVIRYDGALTGLSAFGSRAAGILGNGSVRVIDLATMKAVDYKVPGAKATAFDAKGDVWVETEHELFKEGTSALDAAYRDDALVLHGLTFGGGNLWFGAGTELGMVSSDGKVSLAKADIPADAVLYGSPSGDVWTLSAGTLARYGVPLTGDEADWRTNVLPVYARVCSQCHAPGGSSNIDLSTYDSWAQRRQVIYQRVNVAKNMPQGQTISDEDAQAIATWTQSMKP